VSPEAAKALQNGGGEPKPTHPLPRKRHFEEAIRKNHDFFRGLWKPRPGFRLLKTRKTLRGMLVIMHFTQNGCKVVLP